MSSEDRLQKSVPYWWRVTVQIWIVTRHQYGISELLLQTSFPGETNSSVWKCRPFCQATSFWGWLQSEPKPLQDQSYLISKSYFWIKRFWITAHLPLPYANILAQGRNIRVSEIKVRMICLRRPFTIRRRPPLKKIWGFVVSLYSARLEDEVQITFVK